MREKGTYVDLPYGLYLELEEEADRRNASKKQVHIEALEAYLGISADESEAVIRRKLKREKRDMRDIKEEFEDMQRQLNQKEAKISSYEEVLKEQQSSKVGYEDRIADICDQLVSGDMLHCFENHEEVVDICDEYDRSPSEVIYDAREYAIENEYDLYNTHFMRAKDAKYTDEKPLTEEDDE
jgi:UDP-glucose 6-dehydrogenase